MSDRPGILITGTREGLGASLTRHYLDRGYRVVGCSRGPSDLDDPAYEHHRLDVRDEAAVLGLFRRLRGGPARLSALVNNAGIARMNHALMTPVDAVREILETNVTATFLFCREAAKLLRGTEHARIVNLSSVAVPLQLEGEAAYAASKAAVEMLTRILARELAPLGITCNAVGPAPVRTSLLRGVPEATIERLLARQAIPRYAEPEEVANVVDFFLQPASDFVTGQVVYLGGVS